MGLAWLVLSYWYTDPPICVVTKILQYRYESTQYNIASTVVSGGSLLVTIHFSSVVNSDNELHDSTSSAVTVTGNGPTVWQT
jgi:hypothetical protein